jgi:hypothetical protein
MILTPIDTGALDAALAAHAAQLAEDRRAAEILARIGRSRNPVVADPRARHEAGVTLCERLGMEPLDEAPQDHLSWDGARVRTRSESAVLIHEAAHYQVASPARRRLPDFGLGAGPESGRVEIAEACRCVPERDREAEEQMASLLGILWEIELGHPGIEAFLEQNWLEGAGRKSAADFFRATLDRLIAFGLVDPEGHPVLTLRASPDP